MGVSGYGILEWIAGNTYGGGQAPRLVRVACNPSAIRTEHIYETYQRGQFAVG